MKLLRTTLLSVAILAAAACSNVQVTDYNDFKPAMEVEQFFNGRLTAHGVVKDRGGRVIRIFLSMSPA